MNLIPFSAQYLDLEEPLPFGLRDASGRLLLAAGQTVPSAGRLEELQRQPLYAAESEAADWHRRLKAAMDVAVRQGSTLKAVVAARPDAAATPREAASAALLLSWPEQWEELVSQLDVALRDVTVGGEWRARLFAVHSRARQLFQRRPDASLYCLVSESIASPHRYSCRHALLVLVISEHAGAILGWPAPWIDALGRAALTMNAGMLRLQDQLACSQLRPTPAMRVELAAHPQTSAAMLDAGGLGDPLCLDIVRRHHQPADTTVPLAQQEPEHQLGELLRRVDIYTAKISRRAWREPMSPVQAAREACLVADGRPDEIGGALLKAVGLYPPGCFVELAGGEVAAVLARGRTANQPSVATLVAASGLPLGEPALRDTSDRRYAVKGLIAANAVRVRPSHQKLLAMR